jgi:hypothetical protein
MAKIARSRTSFHATSHVGFMDWIAAPLVSLLAMSWPRRLACVSGTAVALIGVVSLAGHVFNGWSPHLWGAGRLPTSASERAPLFTAAWTSHDELRMKQFVLAADETKLHAWVAATPVPASVAAIQPSDRTIKTISLQKDDMDGAVLEVRISAPSAAGENQQGSGGDFTQRQMWTCSAGNWYFSPEAPPASAAGRKVAMNPPSTTARSAVNSQISSVSPDETGTPTRAPTSRNVVIPSTVPPWARVR